MNKIHKEETEGIKNDQSGKEENQEESHFFESTIYDNMIEQFEEYKEFKF